MAIDIPLRFFHHDRVKGTLGQRVEAVRLTAPAAARISRSQLARLLGVDRSTIANWALGRCSPRDPEAVARVLGVTMDELFAGRRSRRAP